MDTITREEADQRVAEGLTMLADADVSSSGISKRTLDICDASKGVDGGFDLAFAERSDENYAELTAAWKRVL
jgi:predicted O-methyltransferase YrrM